MHNCNLEPGPGVQTLVSAQPSTYQRLLGLSFAELSEVLQVVHGSAADVRGAGWMRVRHGKGLHIRLLNALAGVPKAAERVPLRLRIHRDGGREVWERRFGERLLRTEQWDAGGLFIEQSGPLRMAMRVWVEGGGLSFASDGTWMLGVRVPRWAGLELTARAAASGGGWEVRVETRSRLVGLLFEYAGYIELEA